MDSRTTTIQDILGLMQKNLECSICLDLLTNPVSTKCDHPFCRFCITEFLKTKTSVPCPLCKCPITKRSLNDRPQLSHIVENVRLLPEAFSKDTGHKCSPPRASSSANLLSCTPEQLPRKEAKGTKRKIAVSEKKGISGKSNVRRSKRRKSDITPEVKDSTQDITGTDDLINTNGVETDQSNIDTDLYHRIVNSKGNKEESKTDQILRYLRSGSHGAMSEKGDPSCINSKALTTGNTDLVDTNLKSRTRSTSQVSVPEKGEEWGKTTENLNSERHLLRLQNRKNYKEDSDEVDICDDEQVQGYSESQGHSEPSSLPESTPHVATVTRTYDKQFVSRKNVRSVSKVKDWLTNNSVQEKVQGDMQESEDLMHGDSLEQLSYLGDDGENLVEKEGEEEEEIEIVSCDSSAPETANSEEKEQANTSDKNPVHSQTALTSLPVCSDNVPPTTKSQNAMGEKGDHVAHKIFKTTRNNKHMETSVKQKKGKFLFKKIQPRSVSGIDQGKGVKPLKPKETPVVTHKESLKLRELDLNTFGNDSDPYEFKSSPVAPVKPRVQRKKAREDKRKEGQISVDVQSMLSRKSGKSILKKAGGDNVEGMISRSGGEEAGEGRKKKLSPKALQRQKDEEEALEEMRDKISQAESYDLVTCTQEVIDHLTEEENGTEGEPDGSSKNKKIVSFNHDVIFISSQNQSGVKSLKGMSESPKNLKTQSNNVGKHSIDKADVTISEKEEQDQRTEKLFMYDNGTKGCHEIEKMEEHKVHNISENLIGEISENILSSTGSEVENKTTTSSIEDDHDDDDDVNSSSTTDLDIQPEESEFEVPNLDIQPKEILEKLSSQDLTPNNFVKGKNITEYVGTVMEVDIVPNSEDLKNDTSFPKYLKKSIKEETTKAKNSTRNKIKEGCKLDEYNVNLNKGDRKRGFTNQDLEKSPDLPVVDRGKELDRVGNGQTINISDGGADVNSLNVVPETPLIAIDSETFITDASNPPQKKNLIRKSRLKKSNKEQTSKKSPVAARCEETHTNRTDTNLSTNMPCAKEKEMSESIIPPSVDMSVSDMVVLEHQSGKEGSESTSTHLSSETQDSQTSAGRKLRSSESTSTQQSNETQNSQDYEERKLRNSDKKRGKRKAASSVIPETPVQGEVKTTEEEVTEMSRKQKENTAIMTDSQQSLSSLCSTQESVSILAPVHKTFEKIVEKNSPASSKENLMAVNRNEGQNKDIIEIKSQETEGDIQEKSSSCEIIAEGESLVMKSENNQSLRSSSYKLRRPKRKCFSLTSPDKGPKMESLARNDVCRVDDEEMVKQNSSKIEKKGKCKEDLEIVNDVKEKKQRIYEKNHSEVKSSEDIKSTPIDALIPTQLSLKSIKKQEMKLKKQQQSSPEDVFLMDSETPVSGSGYQDLVQNQEGLLELELGDLDGVCEMDTGDSQVKSSIERGSGKVDNTVDGDTDHVEKSSNVKKEYSQVKEQTNEYMECGGSSNEETYGESGGKNSESHTVTTIPDTERNEEELLHQKKSRLRSVRDVPGDGDILQMDRKMTENSDSLKNSNSQKNCRTSRSDVSNAGKRAVRGLARKLRQKNVQDPLSVSDECRKLKALDRGDCNREPSNSSREDISIIEKKEKRYQSVEAPVCFGVVPETMEVGLEDLDQVDDEVTTIPETVENSLPGDEEEHDTEMEARTVRDEEGDTDIEDEKTTCIQEKLEQDDIEKRKGKGTGKSQISVKEDSLKMDGIQEGEDNKVNMDIVEPKPEQGTSQGDRNGGTVGDSKTVTKEGSYMETAADDEPLFHSLESSPLPDILEEEDEMQKERLSECALKSGGALPQKKVDPYDSSSSDFDLLPEDIINPEDMTPDNSPRKVEDYNNGNSSVDFVQVWEGKVPSYERDTKSEGMGTKSEKRCEKEEMKNFVDLSDDSDDDDKLIHRGRKWKKVVISDSDDDDDDVDDDDDGNNDEEEEDIGRKKKKKKTAVIISDDEEETGLTEDWKSKTSVTSDEEDDSDFSHSRQMNLTSSSAFSSQSEGYNTQNQVLLRQELERMKKEMAEIESRISKENQNKSLKMKRSPSPAPSQETAEEPYSEYLRELQTEASEGDSPQQSQKIASKIADEIEACDSDDSSDLFLSPAPPSPPPNDPCTLPIVGMKLSENFKETEEFLQEFRNNEKTSQEKFITEQNPGERFRSEGSSDIEAEEGEDWKIERDLSNHSCKTVDPCEIKESLQKSKNRALGKSSQRGNFTDSKEPSVIQESPQSQKPGKSSVARLKDLYHSTPVSSNKKPQRGQKNTLSFLSPVLTPREFPETNEKVQSPLVHRSPEKDNQSKVFVASGLPFNQLNELRRLVQSHDCKFHPKFSPYTTHLIVKTVPPGSRMCERTLKFFQALAYKCWILDYKWVTDSIAAGRLLEEDPYEISGDTVTNDHHCGPQKSRTKSPTDPGILNGIQFYIIGSSQGLSSDDIRDLIETCGGSVVQEPEKLDRDHLCLIITCAALEDSQETAPSQEIILFNRLYRRHGALTVSREWLLDSLTVYNLQPLSEYVLTSVKGMVIPSL